MPGERLQEFDNDLCDYVVGNVRRHLRGAPERPTPKTPVLRLEEWNALEFPAWFSRQFTRHMPALGDHVWAGVHGETAGLPLNDAELGALASAVDDPPPRVEGLCVWEPHPTLHAEYVECVPEVREALTRQTAEEWAAASAAFAARLCAEPLPLAKGIGVVRDWLWLLRRLLRLMGATNPLPYPLGTHPAPTHPNPPRAPHPREKPTPGNKEPGNCEGATAPTPAMLTPAQIAADYLVSRSTVYAACRAGLLPHYRVPAKKGARGKYLVKEVDLLAWLDTLRCGEPTPPSACAPASSRPAPAVPASFSELNPRRLARAWAAG